MSTLTTKGTAPKTLTAPELRTIEGGVHGPDGCIVPIINFPFPSLR